MNDDTLGVSDVAVVFDRYDEENSIKSMEKSHRGGGEIVSSHMETVLYLITSSFLDQLATRLQFRPSLKSVKNSVRLNGF